MIKLECEAEDLGRVLDKLERRIADRYADKISGLINDLSDARKAVPTLPQNSNVYSLATIKDLIKAVKNGEKIGAIKCIRTLTGLDLKEAKDLFEDAWGTKAWVMPSE